MSAKPAKVDGTVRYSDGISLRVVSVDFAKETKKGPGSFPGRPYAVLKLEVVNNSDRDLSMETVVVTVLDKEDKAVAPVYVDEADVSDFAGTLKRGKKASARYAFAVPVSSRSKVTVVVDFDGAHTSAVFRGEAELIVTTRRRWRRSRRERSARWSRRSGRRSGSFGLQLLAAWLLGASGLGLLSLCLSIIVLATAVASGMVGDSLVILDRRDRAIRGGLQFWALVLAVISFLGTVVVLPAAGLLTPVEALLMGLALVAFQLEELVRRVFMATMRFWRLVILDSAAVLSALALVGIWALVEPVHHPHLLHRLGRRPADRDRRGRGDAAGDGANPGLAPWSRDQDRRRIRGVAWGTGLRSHRSCSPRCGSR